MNYFKDDSDLSDDNMMIHLTRMNEGSICLGFCNHIITPPFCQFYILSQPYAIVMIASIVARNIIADMKQ